MDFFQRNREARLSVIVIAVPVQATPADEGVDVDEAEGFTALKLHHYVKPSLSVPARQNGTKPVV